MKIALEVCRVVLEQMCWKIEAIVCVFVTQPVEPQKRRRIACSSWSVCVMSAVFGVNRCHYAMFQIY